MGALSRRHALQMAVLHICCATMLMLLGCTADRSCAVTLNCISSSLIEPLVFGAGSAAGRRCGARAGRRPSEPVWSWCTNQPLRLRPLAPLPDRCDAAKACQEPGLVHR